MADENGIQQKLSELNQSAHALANLSSKKKNNVLQRLAALLNTESQTILAANKRDLEQLQTQSPAFHDRLQLTPARIQAMIDSLNVVVSLADPVGEVLDNRVLDNGLKIRKIRSPLGVIFLIFESRPNVITEAFSLAFKSGNAIILRGGKESQESSRVLYDLITRALSEEVGLNACGFWGITDSDRSLVAKLLKCHQLIDLVVPRGGESLIDFVTQNTRIPIIKNDRGLCHVYVHEDADLTMATRIVINAKTQRPGVCNAMETLLVHRAVAKKLICQVFAATANIPLTWHGCPETLCLLEGEANVSLATAESWDTEYLDQIINSKVVGSLDEALEHIAKHGSRHSEAIVTRSAEIARSFQERVDAAAVYWNASTRFTDGYMFGLGGEIGISTQKLHVRGPVGLRELTSSRWIIEGTGQVRN